MASGGGVRSMVGLLGSLIELSNQGFLDAITYICGTSGSTWCMASLYNHENWSQNMEDMEKKMFESLTKTKRNWSKTWEKLKQNSKYDIQSLNNFWAYVVIHMLTNEINENKLSSHKASCENGNDPYPVYSAVEQMAVEMNKLNDPGAWFEFTPHRSGFPAYKCFVDTELLGSQFNEGKLLKNVPERDLCYLQGLWGSALASKDVLFETITGSIQKIFHSSDSSDTLENQDNEAFREEGTKCRCNLCLGLQKLLFAKLRKMNDLDVEQHMNDLEQTVQDSCQESKLIHQALISLAKWEWGKTHNFLYQWNGSGDIPADLCTQQYLSLIDAGLLINSAFPLMLPPHRKVDLMLSFDYSAGDPFLTLKSTAEYCQQNNIPFPKIQIDEGEEEIRTSNCYIFEEEEEGVPIVMHFPLFNQQNCAGKVREWIEKYPTFRLSYEESEFENLLEVSKVNVKLSSEQILKKFQYVNTRMETKTP
ncbi:cytosolic phospholipase A2 gamma isoform 2-T2 [Discoglossus pictus]